MKCPNKAKFRYTWAGQDESCCCEFHMRGINAVSQAMGAYQQFIPLVEKDIPCSSNINDEEIQEMDARGLSDRNTEVVADTEADG